MMRTNGAVKTGLLVTFIAASGLVLGQAQDPLDSAPPPPQVSAQDQAGPQGAGPGPVPSPTQNNDGWRRLGPGPGAYGQPPQGGFDPRYAQAPPPPVPAQLTIAPGTFFSVRVNQILSSDRNQNGDAFSATLVKPIVVNGVIVADRGQTIQGRVSEAKKAGRVSGTSRLALELTDLTLVDGSQVPVKTELVSRNGATSEGRDAAGIARGDGHWSDHRRGRRREARSGRRRRHWRRRGRGRRNRRRAVNPRSANRGLSRTGADVPHGQSYCDCHRSRTPSLPLCDALRLSTGFRSTSCATRSASSSTVLLRRIVYGPWGPYYGYPYYYGPTIGFVWPLRRALPSLTAVNRTAVIIGSPGSTC